MGKVLVVVRAAWLLASARFLLKRRDTTTTLERLTRVRRVGEGPPGLDPVRALKAVRLAARALGGVCLPQAVALTALLHRHGHEPMLVLGCQRAPDGTWSAHAWVDVGGSTLQPVVANGHTALAVLCASTGWVPTEVPSAV